jgi:microcystin-dependent protein
MDEYLAVIKGFGGNYATRGFLLCQGQLLPLAQYSALYAVLGTVYGGDGRTTFALPDLRGRAPIGQGQGPGLQNYNLGQAGGTETTTLTSNNMPLHTHTATSVLYAEGETANETAPEGTMLAVAASNTYIVPTGSGNTPMSNQAITTTVNPAGGSQPLSILSPYLAINWWICTEGLFPSRP